SRVFLPFEQETAEIAQHFGGTGLGLAITHNLVNLMGGSIDVQSEEGKGSTFTIDLPFGISKDSAKHSESLLELRALVIDDDKDTCEHACVLLDQLGQKTEYALSGKEGIEKIKQAMQDNDPFDICFLDWKMPE
ncbi:MAG TPA: hybrid sensor histidine kinase/response regulator, partial [Sutterellaceae bacterium]|nr:hybrid sensor histidine kinase/response regulator [Sutterellaceae bacterium]